MSSLTSILETDIGCSESVIQIINSQNEEEKEKQDFDKPPSRARGKISPLEKRSKRQKKKRDAVKSVNWIHFKIGRYFRTRILVR